ncbi:MAG: DUF4139 domain-containing protein [Cytophagaceae bacterium]
MKKIIFIFIICLSLAKTSNAQAIIIDQSGIKEVKVFFQGAEISRTFSATLPAGRTELKIVNLSTSIDPNSIIVTSAGAKVISIYNEVDFADKLKNDEALRKLRDSIQIVQSRRAQIEFQQDALEEEGKVLLKNSARVGNTQGGISLSELDQTSIYLRRKLEEIAGLAFQKEKELNKYTMIYDQLRQREQELQREDSSSSTNVYVLAETSVQQKCSFSLSYYVKSCGWAPTYNIYSKGTGTPLDMEYKANVLNNCGEDWNKVKLTLLAGNPSRSLSLPNMETWVLAYQHKRRTGKVYGYNESGDEGALSKKQIKNGQTGNSKAYELQEIEMEEGEMVFGIEGSHTIPSSERKYMVDISRSKVDASYLYQTVPKIDAKAYLIAKVKDWENLKLIEGDANIFLNDTYVGRTYLDPLAAGDTLDISLGPDPAIQITRVKKKDFSTRKLLGLHLIESFVYEIDVRNLNKTPIFIEVFDQVPIPQQEEIQITRDEMPDVLYQENTGKLTWKLEIPGAQTSKIKMGYSIKYPRDKMVLIKRTGKVVCPKFR